MRIGEALALTPSDISPYTISVKSTLRKMTYKGSRITNIGPPKNKSSERIIDIPHFLYNQIMNYINSLYGLEPNQTIITLAYTTIYNKMCSTIEKTGLPHISPHILRHSYATILGSLSDVVVVSGQLGHSSPKTTMQTYTHLLPGKASQAVEKFEKLIINSKNFSAGHIINSN
jgi:integrase